MMKLRSVSGVLLVCSAVFGSYHTAGKTCVVFVNLAERTYKKRGVFVCFFVGTPENRHTINKFGPIKRVIK